jgi:hypothetical protein
MNRRRATAALTAALSLALTVGLTLGLAPAASAAELTITDPARDNQLPGLDIVGATLDNADYVLAAEVNMRVDRSGTVIVGLKARQRPLIRLVSRHDVDGRDRTFLVDQDGARVRCDGLHTTWNTEQPSVTVGVPSTCLWQGNYGAVRPWFLTEGLDSGSDVDFAATDMWTPRG